MRCNCEHRHPAAVAVEEAVYEVQVAGPAAACANGEFAGQMRLGTCCERSTFLMTDVHPVYRLQAPERIGKAVQGIADNAVDALHPLLLEGLCDVIGHRS